MRVLPLSPSNPAFPADFVPLGGTPRDCDDCGKAVGLGFQFDYAYQPIVDVGRRVVFAHEALVRGPNGEGAATVLSQVNDHNRYRFDQACRVKAIKGAAELGLTQPVSINFLPNAIYKPEVCIRTTLEAARAHGFPLSQIIFEVTEGAAEGAEVGAVRALSCAVSTGAATSRLGSWSLTAGGGGGTAELAFSVVFDPRFDNNTATTTTTASSNATGATRRQRGCGVV